VQLRDSIQEPIHLAINKLETKLAGIEKALSEHIKG